MLLFHINSLMYAQLYKDIDLKKNIKYQVLWNHKHSYKYLLFHCPFEANDYCSSF